MLLLTPRVSEKAYAVHQQGTFVFNVPMIANKAGVILALKEQYNVQAKDVRFVIQNGKPVRASRGKRAQPGQALRSKRKKCYVRLVEGSTLNLFEEADNKSDTKGEK